MNDLRDTSPAKEYQGIIEQKAYDNSFINLNAQLNKTNQHLVSEGSNLPSGQQLFVKKRGSNNKVNQNDSKYNQYSSSFQGNNQNPSLSHLQRDPDSFQRLNHTVKYKQQEKQRSTLLLQTLKVKLFISKLIGLSEKNRFNKIQQSHFTLIDDYASNFTQQTQNKQQQHLRESKFLHTQDNLKHSPSQLLINAKGCLSNSTLFTRLTNTLNKIPVISPSGTFKFIWDIVMMIVIVAYLFMIPIEVTFYKPLNVLFSNYILFVCNTILTIDFMLQWNLGYFEKGLPNMNRIEVMAKYFKSQVYFDFCSSFFLVAGFFTDNNQANVFHLLFFLRFKTAKHFFKKLEERFNLNPFIMQLSSLAQLLLLIVTVSHIIGCIWISVSHYETQIGINSWISDKKLDSDDWFQQYVHAYYFSTVTMITVGYGDFKPINSLEMIVSIMTMLTSCGVFAYSINAVGLIFNSINKKHADKFNNLYTIGSYMEKKNINFQLQIQIKEYLEYYWDMQNTRDMKTEQNLINQLSAPLKIRLMHETFKMIIQDYPIFKENFSEDFMMSMISIIEEHSFRPEEMIVSETADEEHSIYFIESGKVALFLDEDGQKVVRYLKKGDMFGDLSFFTGQSININVKAIEFTCAFKIKRSQFQSILQQYPKDQEIFCNIQDILIYQQNYSIINTRCFICNEHHPIAVCRSTFPKFNRIKIINIYNKSEQQMRQTFQRFVYKKFPTFVNYHYSLQQNIKYAVDRAREVEQYYIKYILKDDEEEDYYDEDEDDNSSSDDKVEYTKQNEDNNQDDESISRSTRSNNLHSQFEQTSPFDQHKDKHDNKLLLQHFTMTLGAKANLTPIADVDEKESPTIQTPSKHIKRSSFAITNNNAAFNIQKNSFNTQDSQLSIPQNTKKSSSISDAALLMKRNLIKLQLLETGFQHSNSYHTNTDSFDSPRNKQLESPGAGKTQKSKLMNQISKFDTNLNSKHPKKRVSFKQLPDQTNINELADHLQQIIQLQSKFQESKDQSEENQNFEIQKNFDVYLPQNNLSNIIEYLKFKQRYIKQLKAIQRGNPVTRYSLNQNNNTQYIIDQKNAYLYQYPFNTPSCNRNFQIMRVFNQKMQQLHQKKKLKTNHSQTQLNNSKISKSKKGIQANTRMQRLLEKFEYISAQEITDPDNQSFQINQSNNNSNFIVDQAADETPLNRKQQKTQTKFNAPVYKQSSFYSKQTINNLNNINFNDCRDKNNSFNNLEQSLSNSQVQSFIENKNKHSTLTQINQFQSNQDTTQLKLYHSNSIQQSKDILNRYGTEDIDSPFQPKTIDIHSSQNIKPKEQYFNEQSGIKYKDKQLHSDIQYKDSIEFTDTLTSPNDTNRPTLQQQLKLNNLMKNRQLVQNGEFSKKEKNIMQKK